MADLLSLGGSALANVPDPTAYVNTQIANQQAQQINAGNIQQQAINNQNSQRAQQMAVLGQQAAQAYFQDPNAPGALEQVGAYAPGLFKGIQDAHLMKTTDQQNSDLRSYTGLEGQASIAATPDDPQAGPTAAQTSAREAVLSMLGDRVTADTAAKRPSDTDAALLAQAQGGNFNGVLGGSRLQLRAILGPEKYADLVNSQTTASEAPSVIAKNQADADQAEGTLYRSVKNADGSESVIAVGNAANAGGASGAPSGGAGSSGQSPAPNLPPGPVGAQMAAAATGAGATPAETAYLGATARLESNGKPSAQNGSSSGLFQFHPQTFAAEGGGNISSVGDQTVAALRLARQNNVALTKSLGQAPTADQVYLAHQQGAMGAAALINAPAGMSAVAALQQAGVAPKAARLSITGNGGTENMPASAFVAKWAARYNNVAGQGGAPAASGSDGTTTPNASAASSGTSSPGVRIVYQPTQSSMLTPAAVDQAAQQYLLTGEIPSTGMGETATLGRNAIMNRAAEIQQQTGRTGYDAAIAHAGFGAQQTALTNLTTMGAQIDASEGTAANSMGIVQSLIPKGSGPTGSPMLNAPIQAIRKTAWGSQQVASFDAAVGTFSDEYAKIMTSATGAGGQTTDSARNEAYERLNKAGTPGQLLSTMGTMRQEMAGRRNAINAQIQSVQGMMRGVAGQSPDAPLAAGGQALSPQQAASLPPGSSFKTTDGRVLVRH